MENTLLVWHFDSTVRELMDAESAEPEAAHAQDPNQQEDTAGPAGSLSVPLDSAARKPIEVLSAAVYDHPNEPRDDIAEPIESRTEG